MWPDKHFLASITSLGIDDFLETLQKQRVSQLFFSYHPRILTEEESQNTKMFYGEFLGTSELSLYYVFEHKMIKALGTLHYQSPIFWFEQERLQLETENSLRQHIQLGLRDEALGLFFVPDKKILMVTGYDLTWMAYFFSPENNNFFTDILKNNAINYWHV